MAGNVDATTALIVRRATVDDRALFFASRKDPRAVAMSMTRREITEEEHATWYAWAVESPGIALFVAETYVRAGDETFRIPIGAGRIDLGDGEIGIAILEQHRGIGLGTLFLEALTNEGRKLGLRRLYGQIRMENVASLRAFQRVGFSLPPSVRLTLELGTST